MSVTISLGSHVGAPTGGPERDLPFSTLIHHPSFHLSLTTIVPHPCPSISSTKTSRANHAPGRLNLPADLMRLADHRPPPQTLASKYHHFPHLLISYPLLILSFFLSFLYLLAPTDDTPSRITWRTYALYSFLSLVFDSYADYSTTYHQPYHP